MKYNCSSVDNWVHVNSWYEYNTMITNSHGRIQLIVGKWDPVKVHTSTYCILIDIILIDFSDDYAMGDLYVLKSPYDEISNLITHYGIKLDHLNKSLRLLLVLSSMTRLDDQINRISKWASSGWVVCNLNSSTKRHGYGNSNFKLIKVQEVHLHDRQCSIAQ